MLAFFLSVSYAYPVMSELGEGQGPSDWRKRVGDTVKKVLMYSNDPRAVAEAADKKYIETQQEKHPRSLIRVSEALDTQIQVSEFFKLDSDPEKDFFHQRLASYFAPCLARLGSYQTEAGVYKELDGDFQEAITKYTIPYRTSDFANQPLSLYEREIDFAAKDTAKTIFSYLREQKAAEKVAGVIVAHFYGDYDKNPNKPLPIFVPPSEETNRLLTDNLILQNYRRRLTNLRVPFPEKLPH